MTTLSNIRVRAHKHETYHTPAYSYLPLLDYRPDWFTGSVFDPSAGDGHMVAEILRRGNTNTHFVGDIREEEQPALHALPNTVVRMGDYLSMTSLPNADCLITNPPFSLSTRMLDRAHTHIRGPICILQSVQWQSTQRRSMWMKSSGLAYVLNLSRRPKWEVDEGAVHSNLGLRVIRVPARLQRPAPNGLDRPRSSGSSLTGHHLNGQRQAVEVDG